MVIVAAVVGGIVSGAVWLRKRASAEDAPAAVTKESAAPVAAGGHRFAKYIEISGFRMAEERQKPVIKMVVVNHSAGDLGEVKLRISVQVTDGKKLGTTEVSASLGPFGVADVTAPLKSKLRAYELPDWQFIRATFDIISE
jgi:hypothetical protein